MSDFRYTCPNCNTTLKTAAAIPEGKAIKCPKCQTVFKPGGAPAPAAPPASRPPVAPPPAKAPAPPPARVSAEPPVARTPAAKPGPPPAKTATTATPKESAPVSREPGTVHITDHKGEVTLPKDWKKKKPKSGGNLPIILGIGGGGLLVLLVCSGCCCIPIMTAETTGGGGGGGPSTKVAGTEQSDKGIGGPVTLSKDTIVGSWTQTNNPDPNKAAKVTFNDDQSVDWEQNNMPLKGKFVVQGTNKIQIDWEGLPKKATWTISNFTDKTFMAKEGGKTYIFLRD